MPRIIVVRNNLELDRFNFEDNFRTKFQTPKLLLLAMDMSKGDTNCLEFSHSFLGNNSMFKFLKDVDELSLSTGKSININLIKKVLNQ